jgi:hypothetical protein
MGMPGLHARADHQRRQPQVAAAEALEREEHRRHDRGEGHRGDGTPFVLVERHQAVEEHGVFIAGAGAVGRHAPVRGKLVPLQGVQA